MIAFVQVGKWKVTPSTVAFSCTTIKSDIREALATYFATCWQLMHVNAVTTAFFMLYHYALLSIMFKAEYWIVGCPVIYHHLAWMHVYLQVTGVLVHKDLPCLPWRDPENISLPVDDLTVAGNDLVTHCGPIEAAPQVGRVKGTYRGKGRQGWLTHSFTCWWLLASVSFFTFPTTSLAVQPCRLSSPSPLSACWAWGSVTTVVLSGLAWSWWPRVFMQCCLFDGRQSTQFFPNLEHEQFLHLPLPLHWQHTGMVQALVNWSREPKRSQESPKSTRSTFCGISVSHFSHL